MIWRILITCILASTTFAQAQVIIQNTAADKALSPFNKEWFSFKTDAAGAPPKDLYKKVQTFVTKAQKMESELMKQDNMMAVGTIHSYMYILQQVDWGKFKGKKNECKEAVTTIRSKFDIRGQTADKDLPPEVQDVMAFIGGLCK